MLKFIIRIIFISLIIFDAHWVKADQPWQQALPGLEYQFPRDHAVHPDFKTEWWYFTGNLKDEKGEEFGFELTFFRQGVLTPGVREALSGDASGAGRFAQSDFKFAHFALSDLNHGKFYFVQKINRGAFGEAGFSPASAVSSDGKTTANHAPLAWIEQWQLLPQSDGSWRITAEAGGETPMSIDLQVQPLKAPVIEGTDGVSQKGEGLGNASHYYSFTRLQTSGTLSLGKAGPKRKVRGQSWFDHEWASNQLSAEQVGWDWYCCQFDDGTELMLYAMRRRDGSVDAVSSGTWVDAQGNASHLQRQDFRLQALRRWKSGVTGATYPVDWQVSIPGQQLEFTLKARLDAQELVLPPLSYWEGATAVEGQRTGHPIKGVGYMELTGYASALKGLQSSAKPVDASVTRATR